ncbi:MAG: ECF transporter S component [Eubacteriales bacterium]|nr:ECF transporter S component [Eubacteriales bacterium]
MLLEIRNLNFTYPGQSVKALSGIDLTVREGEFVLLCGTSGCGKSTLLKNLKTVLTPAGTVLGEVRYDGKKLSEVEERIQAKEIGFISQSPENQIVTDKVWHELAFGLESLGTPSGTIRKRVAEIASFFGIESWFHKDTAELSGGQKQLLILASVMVTAPKLLILDEPTSQLDPIAASDFIEMLSRINREFGTTILITEHRLEEVFSAAGRVIVMDRGAVISDGTPRETGKLLRDQKEKIFSSLPSPVRIWAAAEKEESECPVSVSEGRNWIGRFTGKHTVRELPPEVPAETDAEVKISAKGAWFRYEKEGADIVRGLDLILHKGEFLALLGGNGTGKSTVLKLLSGTGKACRGKVKVHGKVSLLPQDPRTLFVKDTVLSDLQSVTGDEKKIRNVIRICRLDGLLERHPYDLSGGEQQRAALAKVLLSDPEILLLDEPTKGIDGDFKYVLAKVLYELMAKGVSVLMVSHDVEFCARYAQRCALFFDGQVISEGTPRKFFCDNCFYTTAASRMARGILRDAVTAEDVIYALGTDVYVPDEERCFPEDDGDLPGGGSRAEDTRHLPPEESRREEMMPHEKTPLPKSTVLAAGICFLLIPFTIYFGLKLSGNRGYYGISLMVVLECLIPFFLIFEGRKPRARELVVIAVMCALGVIGRMMFAVLPEFKPVFAVTIVAGIALGAETGFLVGALTMLLSNMVFGQGPWTPWQMFALGLIGFLSGICFRKGLLRPTKLVMAVFGAVTAVFVFGGIMNPASALMWQQDAVTAGMIAAYFAAGLPFDLANGAAAFLFLYFGGEPVLKKLERVKVKYGI